MKRKLGYIILPVIIGILLGIGIVGIEVMVNRENVETSNYKKDELTSLIYTKTLSEIIYEASKEVYKGPGPSEGKIAYITIDDGPSKYTNRILDILKENNVKATFFLIDGNMKKHESEVKRIVEEGSSVGFHSVSHDKEVLYKTPENTLEEFNTCKETFKSITGKESNLIRLPYGSKPYMPESSKNLLEVNNYLMWDWNLDTEDWRATTDNIVSNVLYYARNRDNLVILMHEKEQTVEALEGIITVLKERGYTILPIRRDTQARNFWDKNL